MAKKQNGTKIKKWLEAENLTVNFATHKGFEFSLEAVDKGSKIVFVVSQPTAIDVITISAQIPFGKDVTDLFKKVQPDLKQELTQSLHRELLKIIHDHTVDKDLKNIVMTQRIYLDGGLSRHNFMDAFIKVRNAHLYLISVLRGHFAGLKMPHPTTGYTMYH